jgi:threonylcarbamoyladenosine tRNA methylthiotransferase MtaB
LDVALALLKTVTLGCKVNQYETELVREGLASIGYADAADDEPADLCVVNTCTVTAEGDAKSRQAIRRLAKENPAARIVVMGCYATRAPGEVAALPGVAEVLADKRELPDFLGRFGVRDVPTGISGFRGHARAWVKVQDGCLLRCSYCIIPLVRPVMSSRPMQHIADEVRRLVENGYREIVLTGIHLGHYGVEQNGGKPKCDWLRLSHLLEALARLPGEFRLRLSSIEATEVTRELVDVMAAHRDKVCPHLHLCLQSGSDEVLARMKRRWGAKRFIDRCLFARDKLDRPALTTDVIVGFPGETDADFEQTCLVAREVGFSKIHVFSFSPRKGTPAAEMPNQVPKPVKQERHDRLLALDAELREAYFRSLLGRKLQVLVENYSENERGRKLGTACRYAPVEFDTYAAKPGEFVDVLARESSSERIVGEPQVRSRITG